jgi:hypothetical protein
MAEYITQFIPVNDKEKLTLNKTVINECLAYKHIQLSEYNVKSDYLHHNGFSLKEKYISILPER